MTACTQSGCSGTIATDDYCDTCGIAASSQPASPTGAPSHAAASMASIGAPSTPSVSARLATTPTGSSRRTSSTRTGRTRARLGAGLVTVAPTPVGDPAAAVMSAEDVAQVIGAVPEDKRHCTACGKAVGRGTPERPGRVTGFCGSCRTPFDFQTNAPALSAGELVGGQYEILGPLAHGGMGWIYLGRDKAVSDRWVVLKGLLDANDPDAALAAVAERQYLAQIEHANIVNIYNFVTWQGAGYIVMEYVGGESLNSKLKQRRRARGGVPDPLPPAEAISYVLGVLPAFGYLHGLGLVYNDLKPANIMALADDVKLIDVGAVMRLDDPHAAIFGTAGFQAPEIATLGPSPASDIYTVGRTLAVLILDFVFHTGRYEHELPEPADEPVFAQWESLYRLLLKATAPHPNDRFQTAVEMADQLTGVLREIVARSDGTPRPTPSSLFGGDRMTTLLVDAPHTVRLDRPDWHVLPVPRVDPADGAAAFLADLPETDPAETLRLLDAGVEAGQVPHSLELRLRRVRATIAAGVDSEGDLAHIDSDDPWEWRTRWYRAVRALSGDDPLTAAELFSQVWTDLAGEIAPKLGLALAAEAAGQHDRAAQLYELVTAVDPTHVSAAFGLARCRVVGGDRAGAVAAYRQVPPSSASFVTAQVASARTLVARHGGTDPSIEELARAAATVEALQLDARERTTLASDILERAVAATEAGTQPAVAGVTLFGHPLDETSLRHGLEQLLRERARLAPTSAERIELVDRANAVRPVTLV